MSEGSNLTTAGKLKSEDFFEFAISQSWLVAGIDVLSCYLFVRTKKKRLYMVMQIFTMIINLLYMDLLNFEENVTTFPT